MGVGGRAPAIPPGGPSLCRRAPCRELSRSAWLAPPGDGLAESPPFAGEDLQWWAGVGPGDGQQKRSAANAADDPPAASPPGAEEVRSRGGRRGSPTTPRPRLLEAPT
ncbi:unnamed protein product [Prorocentrum cordatum]|uniref:Uncharacterized protein n=1 Tax=Prorocentrum cordatum TaxID=2364126 RepID=A0ABN9X7R3_9DINO|nr:unnamed protein product [Polarella glacialis]